MKKTEKQMIKILEEKYEVFMLIGQDVEFGKTDLYVNGHTIGLMDLLFNMCDQYPPLIEIMRTVIKDIDEKQPQK